MNCDFTQNKQVPVGQSAKIELFAKSLLTKREILGYDWIISKSNVSYSCGAQSAADSFKEMMKRYINTRNPHFGGGVIDQVPASPNIIEKGVN